jgi:hypothetical protein
MAGSKTQPATNQRIVELLEEVRTQLADARKRDERIARDLARLLERR